jgi:hypothetical protein
MAQKSPGEHGDEKSKPMPGKAPRLPGVQKPKETMDIGNVLEILRIFAALEKSQQKNQVKKEG